MNGRIWKLMAIAAMAIVGTYLCGEWGLLALGMALPLVKDELLSVTKELPNGAATTVSDGIDLGLSTQATFCCGEVLIEAPALATADLGDAATIKYEVYHAASSDFSDEASLYGTPQLTQTGAGGAGAAAATKRVALPTNVSRHIRVKATNSAAGDASDKSFTVSLVF